MTPLGSLRTAAAWLGGKLALLLFGTVRQVVIVFRVAFAVRASLLFLFDTCFPVWKVIMRNVCSHRAGSTFIEVLVVTGMIAVMIALLLPAVQKISSGPLPNGRGSYHTMNHPA